MPFPYNGLSLRVLGERLGLTGDYVSIRLGKIDERLFPPRLIVEYVMTPRQVDALFGDRETLAAPVSPQPRAGQQSPEERLKQMVARQTADPNLRQMHRERLQEEKERIERAIAQLEGGT